MAPSRGTGKAVASASASKTNRRPGRRGMRSRGAADGEIPDAFQSLLDEASNDSFEESDRPLKRRKTARPRRDAPGADVSSPPKRGTALSPGSSPALQRSTAALQTVEESSEDDDSDLEFEDIYIDSAQTSGEGPSDAIRDVSISLQPESSAKPRTPLRKKPASFSEKAHRLLVHKLHVLCLLSHCMYVNGRCNNATVQRHLGTLLSSKTLSYLNPKAGESQFQRNRSFMEGLEQAMHTFNAEYRIAGGGMLRPQWLLDGEVGRSHEPAPPMDRSDFIAAAKGLEGTQDTGNQLFCALLRASGLVVRLVCSLQVLPFASVPKSSTPQKPVKERIYAMAARPSPSQQSSADLAVGTSKSIGAVPSIRRRLGQPSFAAEPTRAIRTNPETKARPTPKLAYPVFWTEVFNEAQQKWIAVDATVTRTIHKANKLEPPASYELNQMTYVFALEDDGVTRDITKRYVKAYNAKTRRFRVEVSEDGTKWMKKAMRFFRRRGGILDRDQVEDAELSQKEAKEGMPANVQDFKDHPYYALERHLKRHEVIHPRREAGKVNAGTAAKPRMETVYRRQDVFGCKSADKWYRLGREIKVGEQPLKHVPARAKRQPAFDEEDDIDTPKTTALYAPYQTRLYVPPPVVRGRVPRNVYGNLDVYVPSMVPSGGVHIRHSLAQQAARLLKVDYADAVTGFKFQGRHGTATVEGCVVAAIFEAAVRAVVQGFEEQLLEDESKARSLEALRLWKKFMTGLKIRERVQGYGDQAPETLPEIEGPEPELEHSFLGEGGGAPLVTAGQFTLAELSSATAKGRKRKSRYDDSEHDDDDTVYEADFEDMTINEVGGGFLPGDSIMNPTNGDYGGDGGFDNDNDSGGYLLDDSGGGFMAEDDTAGGFIPDSNDPDNLIDRDSPINSTDGGFLPDAQPNDDRFGEMSEQSDQPSTKSSQENMCDAFAASVEDRPMSDIYATEDDVAVSKDSNSAQADVPQQSKPADLHLTADDRDLEKVELADHGQESDKGSILSHDPDDDDLEPDWLESD